MSLDEPNRNPKKLGLTKPENFMKPYLQNKDIKIYSTQDFLEL